MGLVYSEVNVAIKLEECIAARLASWKLNDKISHLRLQKSGVAELNYANNVPRLSSWINYEWIYS